MTAWQAVPVTVDGCGLRRAATVKAAMLLALFGSGGCSTTLGTLPLVVPRGHVIGVKVLRVGVEATSCGARLLGIPMGPCASVDDALLRILESDPEGDVVTDVEISSSSLVTGIYDRHCFRVRGTLARAVPTITLVAPQGGHEHAH